MLTHIVVTHTYFIWEMTPQTATSHSDMLISMHALYAKCDTLSRAWPVLGCYFNPRAPHAGCDTSAIHSSGTQSPFQSTHLMRSATITRRMTYEHSKNFNPRTLCGVRLSSGPRIRDFTHFNPRTPCGVRLRKSTETTLDIYTFSPICSHMPATLFFVAVSIMPCF